MLVGRLADGKAAPISASDVKAAYFGSGPGAPPGVPGGLITGVEFGSGAGAGRTIPGSTFCLGSITPLLLSVLFSMLGLNFSAGLIWSAGSAVSFSAMFSGFRKAARLKIARRDNQARWR